MTPNSKLQAEVNENDLIIFCLDLLILVVFKNPPEIPNPSSLFLSSFDIVLILSDINMPGKSGLDLLKEVKDRFPQLKVMMVTAYGDQQNYDRAFALGADDFITKPIDFDALREKINALAGKD